MASITFLHVDESGQPATKTISCQAGESLFEKGWKLGVGIASACVGKGTCGLCRIKVISGEDELSPYNAAEEKHVGNLYYLTKLRLSCQCTVLGEASEVVVQVVPKKTRKKKS